MKRILLLSAAFFFCFAMGKSEKSTVVYDILSNHVIRKVEKMQELIKFTDAQATQLKDLELDYLLKVQKAENCRCCNAGKKVEKLSIKRDKNLQNILTRDQFIKYDAIERDKIKEYPLRLK